MVLASELAKLEIRIHKVVEKDGMLTFNGSMIMIDSTIDMQHASNHLIAIAVPNACPYKMMTTMEKAESRKQRKYVTYKHQ